MAATNKATEISTAKEFARSEIKRQQQLVRENIKRVPAVIQNASANVAVAWRERAVQAMDSRLVNQPPAKHRTLNELSTMIHTLVETNHLLAEGAV